MNQIIQITLVMFLWAICFPLIKLGLPYAPHLTFAAMRGALAGFILLSIAMILGRNQTHNLKTWMMIVGTGLGATTLGFFGMFHASEYVTPGIATVIANTQPMMAAVLASLILKEQLNKGGKIGFLLGFLGIMFIAFPSLHLDISWEYLLGVFYIILAALGITFSNVLIRIMASQTDGLSAMGWQLIFGSFFLAILAFLTEDVTAINWNASFILSLIGLAVPGTALAYLLWYKILNQVELNHANVFSFLVPIFGLTLGVFFFQERISFATSIGIGLIIIGILFVNWPGRNEGLNKIGDNYEKTR